MKKIILLIIGLVSMNLAKAQCTAVMDYYLSSSNPFALIVVDSSQMPDSNYLTYFTFGDGTSETCKGTIHYYNTGGYYTVCMYIVDSARGCFDSTCATIYIGPGCHAYFNYYPSVTNYRTIFFDNKSSGGSYYLWDFGDGDTSTQYSPTHTYASDGRYWVTIVAYDSNGDTCDVQAAAIDIYNTNGCDPKMGYSIDSSDYKKVHFTATGNGVLRYHWIFGDGDTSNQQNPTHTYASDSVYTVHLIAYDSLGNMCDSVISTITIYQNSIGCKANFAFTMPVSTSAGYVVNFYNNTTSSGTPSYYWDFGDNSSSSSVNPTHTYGSPGTYIITLYALAGGRVCDSISKYLFIDSACRASFYVAIDTTSSYSLYLVNNSYNLTSSTEYYWDFGDGDTSTSANPTHNYNSFGIYQVCLTITDTNSGCMSMFCDSIGMDSSGNLLKKDGFTLIVINEDVLSVGEELPNAELNLYPNPSNGVSTLAINDQLSREYNIEIYDSKGQLIQTLNYRTLMGENKLEIDLSESAKGLYFIHLSTENYYSTLRYIHN